MEENSTENLARDGKEYDTVPVMQICRLPFLVSLTISPLVQSLGMVSLSQMVLKRSTNNAAAVIGSVLSISAFMQSVPGSLQLFMLWMASLISLAVVGLMLMLRIFCAR